VAEYNMKKKSMEVKMKKLRIYLLVILLFVFAFTINGLLVMNDITCTFPVGPDKNLIEDNIIEGSKHFLKARSYIDLICYEYEKSAKENLNFSGSIDLTNKAIQELNEAIIRYNNAIEIGNRIGYIEEKRSLFTDFSYDAFIQNQNLNPQIASVVKEYLSKFDVLGLYSRNVDNIKAIHSDLTAIQENLKAANKPSVESLWSLLQKTSEATLFSNYSTIIGSTVLSQCDD
jgi:hypothetical protein